MCIRSINTCRNCSLHAICFRVGGGRELSMVSRLHVSHGELARGEFLYRAGQRSAAFYVLRSGCVKDVLTKRNGAEVVVQFSLPGEAVGLGNLATARAPTSAIAVAASRYCRVSLVFFQKLAGEVPEIGRELVRLLAASVTATHELVASVLEQDAIARVAGCLIDISGRLERAGLDGSRFRLGVSRRDLASYLGVTLETVSRCLTELSKRRLIEVRAKELRLLRPAELQLILS